MHVFRVCRHFDVSTTGQLGEVKEGLALAFLEKLVSRDQLWITATVSQHLCFLTQPCHIDPERLHVDKSWVILHGIQDICKCRREPARCIITCRPDHVQVMLHMCRYLNG